MEKRQRTLTLTRVYDAPRERVFAAWTDARQLARWFGPQHFTVHSCEADPRPGGVFRLCMRSPDGKDYWVRGEYRDVVAPERLVIAITADDENGIARLEGLMNVTLTAQGGKTKLTLDTSASGSGAEAAQMLEGMQQGWTETLGRLQSDLETKGDAMQVQPYLNFDGRCEEALDFYRKALGAKVEMMMRFKDNPEPMPGAQAPGDKVLHACLRIGDSSVMASDGYCSGNASFQGFSLSVTARDDAEAKRFFGSLAEGGKVQQPLMKTFFASSFGMVADRFGVSWMVIAGQQG
jgi:PhnB protein